MSESCGQFYSSNNDFDYIQCHFVYIHTYSYTVHVDLLHITVLGYLLARFFRLTNYHLIILDLKMLFNIWKLFLLSPFPTWYNFFRPLDLHSYFQKHLRKEFEEVTLSMLSRRPFGLSSTPTCLAFHWMWNQFLIKKQWVHLSIGRCTLSTNELNFKSIVCIR